MIFFPCSSSSRVFLEETRRKVQSLEANLHEKKGSEEQLRETEKKLAELKKAHVDLAKDMDSRIKAASQISEKSLERRQIFGTQSAKNFGGEREQKFAINDGPLLSMFDKFDKEIAIVKRNRIMQGSKQEFEGSHNSKLHLSALSTPQILQGTSSLDLHENDKTNDEKFQNIVAHASMLAERAQKRIQKMQVGLNVVKHDLSPSTKRRNYRRNAGKRNKARIKDFCF